MEPNNIEKQIKQKLNAREIQPSAQAWDRLDAMLTVAENKEQKKSFSWLKLAAGFILFMGAGVYFLNQNTTGSLINNSNEIIVETTAKDSVLSDQKNQEVVSVETSEAKEAKELVKPESENSIQNNSVTKTFQNKKQKNSQIVKSQNFMSGNHAVAVSNETKTTNSETVSTIINNEVINESNKNKDIVSVEKPILGKPKLKVDPNALLNQVEDEVDMTFRQKVFQKISKNFKEAKESFASRNQE